MTSTTTSSETRDGTTPPLAIADCTSCADSDLLDTDHTILKRIVSGRAWTQIQGKWRDRVYLEPLVKNMEGGTLRDVLKHPALLKVVEDLKRSPLQDLRANQRQGVDVLAAFVRNYTEEDDIQLAQRVSNWARFMARQLVLNETHPFANSPEQKLVEDTQSDLRFWKCYNFKSWTQRWKHPSRGDPSGPVKLVSMDTEKVRCKKADGREVFCLARLCAVGGDYETLIDAFVQPAGPVIDYYAEVHGITEENLRGATLTQAEAQARVMDLITPGTILVGHSLNQDLKELGIDYKRVIDVGMLFPDRRKKESEPRSLADLCSEILGYKLREKDGYHDCLQDAVAPMQLVHHLLGN